MEADGSGSFSQARVEDEEAPRNHKRAGLQQAVW